LRERVACDVSSRAGWRHGEPLARARAPREKRKQD
jgi:hypothetical protein